jgi:septal ring factor EnvC (AmiA/AmiB activator)
LERENRELKEKLAELYLENAQLKNSGTGSASTKRQYLRDHRTECSSTAEELQIMKRASSSYDYEPSTDLQQRDHSDAELRDHIARLQGKVPRLWLSAIGTAAAS